MDLDLKVKAQQGSPERVAEGLPIQLRSTRDGSVIQVPWVQALCLEGRVYGISYGAANLTLTIATFGTNASLALDETDLLQTIPETVAVIPVFFKVGFVGLGTAAEVSAVLAYGKGGVVSGGVTSIIPYNYRPGSGNKSACTYVGLANKGGTVITLEGIIYHESSTALTGAANEPAQLGYEWSVEKAGYLPVMEGKPSTGRQVAAWAHSAQASTGYLSYVFAELPIADIA